MKKCAAIGLLLVMLLLGACSASGKSVKRIGRELGLDMPKNVWATSISTVGGFHGDGVLCTTLNFDDQDCLEQIRQSGDWKPLPLSENLQAVVYGVQTGNEAVGPYIALDDSAHPVVPQMQNGYYYFRDRHSQSKDPADDSDVLNRASLNLTIAMYNADTHTLYYLELDT